MNGNWARTEHVRGKGSAANCMLCGHKPHILEKGFYDGSHSFTVCCPHCWNKHFKDKRETGVSITVVAENVYDAIRDWNKVNAKEQRPHGKWVPGREISQMWTGNNLVGIDYEDFSCSCCGVVVEESTEPEWNFCPNCGADMRRKEGDEK